MHFAFIDIAAAYTVETPHNLPLGGTQAAVCYLAAALVQNGHQATLINQQRQQNGVLRGVRHLPPESLDRKDALAGVDLVVLNGRWTEKLASSLKKRLGAPLVGWMHEAAFAAPHIVPSPAFDAFVFVGPWQQRQNAGQVPEKTRAHIIPNGIAPFFHDLPLECVKAAPPIAVYVGSSKRGLLDLPVILPALLHHQPDLRFEIYSDAVVSRDETENAAFRARLAALAHVDWVGGVAQPELAARLARATYFLSPNTYPETFCIALAESMAAGLHCIVTQRAALPDTAHGFAALAPCPVADTPDWTPDQLDKNAFIAAATAAMANWNGKDESDRAQIRHAQMTFARQHYDWAQQARTWEDLARQPCHSRP